MNTRLNYVEDVSSWHEWQHEYRYGGFYLFPPDELIGDLDQLRARYDPPSYAGCQAHVSLSEPVPRELHDDDIEELQRLLREVQPFPVRYENVHATAPYPGVVYSIEPADAVRRLRDTVHSAPVFSTSSFTRADIAPQPHHRRVHLVGTLLRD